MHPGTSVDLGGYRKLSTTACEPRAGCALGRLTPLAIDCAHVLLTLPLCNVPENPVAAAAARYQRQLQHILDRSSPHATARWGALAALALLYALRVFLLKGFYIVTYGERNLWSR